MAVTSLKLPLQFDPQRLREDLAIVDREWQGHFRGIHYKGDWSALPLISVDGSLTDIVSGHANANYGPTPLLQRCSYFQEVLACFRCRLRRVRLLRLGPGSVIREHVDRLSFGFGVVRIHVPIVTNHEVEFVVAKKRIVMEPGECWYQDVSYPHSVANRGAEARVHLVLDCDINDFIQGLFGIDMSGDPRRNNAAYRRRLRRAKVKDYGRMMLYDRKLLGKELLAASRRIARRTGHILRLMLLEPKTFKDLLWQWLRY